MASASDEIPRPSKFRFYHGGEEYVLASEFAKYLSKTQSQLFATYPALYRRRATTLERALMARSGIVAGTVVTLLLAQEMDAILNEDPFSHLLYERPLPDVRIARLRDIAHAQTEPDVNDAEQPKNKYRMTRSFHAKALPQQPQARPSNTGPSNPLSRFYRVSTGLRSKADYEPVNLIPIRLSIDHAGHRIRDTFVWNANDLTVTPMAFAQVVCQDEEVPQSLIPMVAAAIQSQLDEYAGLNEYDLGDRRCTIDLEINIGQQMLVDRFEWGHDSEPDAPEKFAQQLCSDLGVSSEYAPAIAFNIREQVMADRKAAVNEAAVEVSTSIAKPSDAIRTRKAGDWAPALFLLTPEELERKAADEEREARRRRRRTGDTLEPPPKRRGRRSDKHARKKSAEKEAEEQQDERFQQHCIGFAALSQPQQETGKADVPLSHPTGSSVAALDATDVTVRQLRSRSKVDHVPVTSFGPGSIPDTAPASIIKTIKQNNTREERSGALQA